MTRSELAQFGPAPSLRAPRTRGASCARCCLLGVALAVCCSTHRAALAQIPSDALLKQLQPEGPISDFAHLLKPVDRQVLLDRFKAVEDKWGAQIAVVTLKSLKGGQIDDFAPKLFANWGIGQKGRDNGVLILVSVGDRKARIEVGKGLEPILPDALAGHVLDEQLFPAFRQGKYSEGIRAGGLRVAEIVERGQPPGADELKRPAAADRRTLVERLGLSLFFTPFVLIGCFMLGAAIGAPRLVIPFAVRLILAIWGSLFGGTVLMVSRAEVGHTPFVVLAGLGFASFLAGISAGRRLKPGSLARSRRHGRAWWPPVVASPSQWGDWTSSTWGNSSGGGFGGGGSWGGFGGGSSGGGGASGGW